jgi:hypothetical protein
MTSLTTITSKEVESLTYWITEKNKIATGKNSHGQGGG